MGDQCKTFQPMTDLFLILLQPMRDQWFIFQELVPIFRLEVKEPVTFPAQMFMYKNGKQGSFPVFELISDMA